MYIIILLQLIQMGQCCNPANQNPIIYPQPIMEIIDKLRLSSQKTKEYQKISTSQPLSYYWGELNKQGNKHGYGQYLNGNNQYYGFFKDNVFQGEGILIHKISSNKFQSHQTHQFSVLSEFECQYYYGNFKGGKSHGKGKQVRSKFTFEGIYDNGERVNGKLTNKQLKYQGEFKQNKFDGHGKIQFSNGSKYVGQFHNGKIDGKGEYYASPKINDSQSDLKTQDSYIGKFKQGIYHGYGVYTWNNGAKYEGEYKNGQKNGYGRLNVEGAEFTGKWVNGVKDGQGIVSKDGKSGFGKWKEGKLIV